MSRAITWPRVHRRAVPGLLQAAQHCCRGYASSASPPTAPLPRNSRDTPIQQPPQNNQAPPKTSFLGRLSEAFTSLFDHEKNLEARKKLQKEYATSYWKDLQVLNKTKGKLYPTSKVLEKPRNAVEFPSLPVVRVDAPKNELDLRTALLGHPTFISIVFSEYGNKHSKSFEEPFRATFPHIPIVQLSLSKDTTAAWVTRISMPYIRARLSPQERAESFFGLSSSEIEAPMDGLNVTNRHLGWIFLVDSKGRVRWRAHGLAQPEELQTMHQVTSSLLQEEGLVVKT